MGHDMTVSIAFGLRLREMREERGISQDTLARVTGVHDTAIGRFERGARELRLTTIRRLARGLGVPPGVLVDGLSDPDDEAPSTEAANLWPCPQPATTLTTASRRTLGLREPA